MKTAAFMLCTRTPARGRVISDTQKPVSWSCKRRFRQRHFRHRVAPTLRVRSPPRNCKAHKLSSLNDDTVSHIGTSAHAESAGDRTMARRNQFTICWRDLLERALRIGTRAAIGYSREGVSWSYRRPSDMETILDDLGGSFESARRKKPETATLSANNSERMERERGLTREGDALILPVHGQDRL